MYRHILIPTDGSELAEHGLALTKSAGAKVSVINVVEPLFAVTGDFASVLDRMANAAKEAGVSCETIQLENVQPHQAIIATAEDKGCDLIVMSSHGLSPRGSTAMMASGRKCASEVIFRSWPRTPDIISICLRVNLTHRAVCTFTGRVGQHLVCHTAD